MELKAKCITPDGPCDIYSKSDVDKYLKELEEKHNEEISWLQKEVDRVKRLNESLNNERISRDSKVIMDLLKNDRHHRYKRCKNMADKCHILWWKEKLEGNISKGVWWWRWWNIWIELAEKVKEESLYGR